MAQHFLLSSKARSLSIMNIVKMSDIEAFEMFKSIRWSETNGDVVCPCCGSVKKPYFLKTRMQFRCKECFYTFSVTSGTIFAIADLLIPSISHLCIIFISFLFNTKPPISM